MSLRLHNLIGILLIALSLVMGVPVMAEDHPADHAPGIDKAPLRLGVGDTLPEVSVIDGAGNPIKLKSFQENGPTIFVFFMGSECIGCQQQLIELGEFAGKFAVAGAEVVAVSADDAAGVTKTIANLKRGKITAITVLGDPELTAITALGTRIPDADMSFHSVFLVDREGIIRMVARGNMAPVNLPSPAVLLLELKKLNAPSAAGG